MATMTSMSGKFLLQIIARCFVPHSQPNELEQPSFVWWSGFQCALFYYLVAYLLPLIHPSEAWALICLVLISHAIVLNATGYNIDFTVPFRTFVVFVARLSSFQTPLTGKVQSSNVDPSEDGKQSKKNK